MKQVKGIWRSKWGRRGNRQVFALLMVMFVLLAAGGCAQTSDQAAESKVKPVELSLAHFWPPTHPVETELVQPWIKAIDEATGGQVKITSYPGNTLVQAENIYDGVVKGSADIGISCFSYTRGRFPVLEVFELPGITYANSKVASKVAWEGIQEINPLEVQDTKLMMVFTTGPGDLFTKKAVRSLPDLQGMQIRATGLSAKTLEALGAVPDARPQSEAYEALAKGVVHGNLGPIEVLQGWNQAEVTEYISRTPFLYNTLFFFNINLEKWNSLSPETQAAIEKVNERFFNEVAMGLWDKQNEEALKFAVEKHGMEVITLPQEEADKWISLVKPIQDNYVQSINDKGLDGQAILDQVKALADKYNQELGE